MGSAWMTNVLSGCSGLMWVTQKILPSARRAGASRARTKAYMTRAFVGASIAMRPTALKKPMRTTVATILPGHL